MKTGSIILLCCVAATYCYSIADFADSLAEKIIAKREAERLFDEEEYVPLENNGDDINAGRPEETGNPDEIAEPLVDFTKDEDVQQEAERIFDEEEYVPLENNGDDINAGRPEETGNPGEIEEPLVDFTKDEDVHEEVGNPIEALPVFDLAVANEKTVDSPTIKSDPVNVTEILSTKIENALLALQPESYKSAVARISKLVLTKEFVKEVIGMASRVKKYTLVNQLGVIYNALLKENGAANQDVMKGLLDVIVELASSK